MIGQWFCEKHPQTFLLRRPGCNQHMLPIGRFMCTDCLKDQVKFINTFNFFPNYHWRKRLNERRQNEA